MRGDAIHHDLVTTASVSRASRTSRTGKAVGGGQFWGRMAGRPCASETVEALMYR